MTPYFHNLQLFCMFTSVACFFFEESLSEPSSFLLGINRQYILHVELCEAVVRRVKHVLRTVEFESLVLALDRNHFNFLCRFRWQSLFSDGKA